MVFGEHNSFLKIRIFLELEQRWNRDLKAILKRGKQIFCRDKREKQRLGDIVRVGEMPCLSV